MPDQSSIDLIKQCLEAFQAIPVAADSRKFLKKHGARRIEAYAGNGSHLLAHFMVKEITDWLDEQKAKV